MRVNTWRTISFWSMPTLGKETTPGNSGDALESVKHRSTVTTHWKHVTNRGASFSPPSALPSSILFRNTIEMDMTLQNKQDH